MSIRLVRAALEINIKPAGRKLTLMALAEHADDKGYAFPSRALLSEETGLSRRMLQLYIPALEREGWLRTERHGTHPTSYWLNLEKLKPREPREPREPRAPKTPRRPAKERDEDYDAYARL